jgi:hypothetical protein
VRNYFVRIGVMLSLVAMLVVMLAGCTRNEAADGGNSAVNSGSNDGAAVNAEGAIMLPAMKLPKGSNSASMDMIGLIVYKGKIYTQTATDVDADRAADLIGEKLGRTKASIDEWSKQDDYAEEFASSVGEADVYAVNGYSSEFRIMTYMVHEGVAYAELYECLNGIAVHTGQDIFGQLKLNGNVVQAHYRTHNDWYYSVENHLAIDDMELMEVFVEELNRTVPMRREHAEAEMGDFRNDEKYRELTLRLKDGSQVTLVIIKGGYVRYGNADVFFRMDDPSFERLWEVMTTAADPSEGDAGAGIADGDGKGQTLEEGQAEDTQHALLSDEEFVEQAVADMTRFIELVKAKDAEGVAAYLKRSEFFQWFNVDLASKVIEGFERNFDLASLYVAVDKGNIANSHSPEHQQFGFILADKDQTPESLSEYDHSRMVTFRYEQETGQAIPYNAYVRFYPFAESMVEDYVKLIVEDQAAALSSFLNADDLDIPVWVGEDTIKAYKELLDMTDPASISISNDHGFTFTITDGLSKSHTIEIIYGDGLMGIRDKLIPDFPK